MIPDETMSAILANSYKDFHVKGFDYICLKRTTEYTEKLYFFSGDISALPEVVSPHDHRYDFSTKVVRGRSMNTRYRLTEPWWNNAERFEAFDYMTPLNGGGGFTWRSAAFLTVASESLYGSHCRDRLYLQGASEIHTIKIVEPDTILRLVQYEDVRPLWEPTRFFARAKEPPALDGLYNRFTADEVLERLSRLPEGDPT